MSLRCALVAGISQQLGNTAVQFARLVVLRKQEGAVQTSSPGQRFVETSSDRPAQGAKASRALDFNYTV